MPLISLETSDWHDMIVSSLRVYDGGCQIKFKHLQLSESFTYFASSWGKEEVFNGGGGRLALVTVLFPPRYAAQ